MSVPAAVLGTILAVLSAAGCGEDGGEVLVDVRTDLVAGREFVGVRTTIGDRRIDLIADPGADFQRGARVAEIGGVKRGTVTMRVALVGPGGAIAVEREVRVRVEERVLVTVVLTRSCQGVACPGPADPETLSACLGGLCVDPRCAAEEPEACGTPMCRSDSECTAPSACAVAECRAGTCFAVADDTRCSGGLVCDPDEGCVGEPVDAGPSDAGPPDAGPRDAGPRPVDTGPPMLDDTACDDVHADALFCDGFESGDTSAWLWESKSAGDVHVQAGSSRGRFGLEAAWNADGDAGAYVEVRPMPSRSSGDLWARAYFFVESEESFDALNVLGLGEAGGANESNVVVFRDGVIGVYVQTAESLLLSPVVVPRDRWFCVELHIAIGAAGGRVELFVDGALADAASMLDTLPASGYSRLTAGAVQYAPRTTARGDMFLDEIVLDDTRVGCD